MYYIVADISVLYNIHNGNKRRYSMYIQYNVSSERTTYHLLQFLRWVFRVVSEDGL